MFQGYNRVIQLGNLTTDPELRRFAGGKTLLRFPLAVTEQVNTAGGVQDKTLRLTVLVWGSMAEVAGKHLHKGDRVLVDGRLAARNWTSADNQSYSVVEMVVEELVFLGGPNRPLGAPGSQVVATDSFADELSPADVAALAAM